MCEPNSPCNISPQITTFDILPQITTFNILPQITTFNIFLYSDPTDSKNRCKFPGIESNKEFKCSKQVLLQPDKKDSRCSPTLSWMFQQEKILFNYDDDTLITFHCFPHDKPMGM